MFSICLPAHRVCVGTFFTFLFMCICLNNSEGQAGKEESKKMTVPDTPTITQHQITIGGKAIDYTARTGYLTLETENGDDQAHIFYIAYTKNNVSDPRKRPITFSFNGGPGSSSVWLHLGVLGPRRVLMTDEGESLPPPYELVDNDYSWLDLTDMVFIDPVTTGLSRAADEKESKKYHGYDGDIRSVAEFIRRYVSEQQRWASPKYVIGESYGTTRAAGLSSHLINEYGFYLNGIILVSSIMDFQTARFEEDNDLPAALFLPTYAASAYYHKRLHNKYLQMPLADFLNEVEQFVANEYTIALFKGNSLSDAERGAVADKISQYTGLSKTYIERANLRVNIHQFTKELLRDQYQAIGRFDSRYKHTETNGNAESTEIDPSYQPTILGCYATLMNDYLGRELKFQSKLPYNILTGRVHPWDFSPFTNRYVNTAQHLRKAMMMNPHMKVWIANGYYDLATPYYATEFTVNHLDIDKKLQSNIQMTYYPAGHMMYLQKKSLVQMKEEAKGFFSF